MMRARNCFLTGTLVMVAAATTVASPTAVFAGSKVEVGRRCSESQRPSLSRIARRFSARFRLCEAVHGFFDGLALLR